MGRGIGHEMGRGMQRGILSSLTSQTSQIQQRKAFVEEDKCSGCGTCAEYCKMEAVTIDDVAKIDIHRCIGCGDCIEVCPLGAIFLKRYP
jgi:hypothetical protein